MKKIYILLALLLLSAASLGAQNKVALKTNLLYDAALSPNLAVEYSFAPKWSVDVMASVNRWKSYGHTWRHVIVQPELRYWTCESFRGFFVGVHALGGKASIGDLYDFSQYIPSVPNFKESYLQRALTLGGGIACGYDIVLCRHWNIEFEAGVGYVYLAGKEWIGEKLVSNKTVLDYVGPTKLAVNIVYLF